MGGNASRANTSPSVPIEATWRLPGSALAAKDAEIARLREELKAGRTDTIGAASVSSGGNGLSEEGGAGSQTERIALLESKLKEANDLVAFWKDKANATEGTARAEVEGGKVVACSENSRPTEGGHRKADLEVQPDGGLPWRDNKRAKSRRREEVHIDVIERYHVEVASCLSGGEVEVLREEVTGCVAVKACLWGMMPKCSFGLNDRLQLEAADKAKEAGDGVIVDRRKRRDLSRVDLLDIKLAECVDRDLFEERRHIVFVPPDNVQFDLLSYRVAPSADVSMPFRFVVEVDDPRPSVRHKAPITTLRIKLCALFSAHFSAHEIVVTVPLAPGTATAKATTKHRRSRARWQRAEGHLVWRLRKARGGREYEMVAKVEAGETTGQAVLLGSRIALDFKMPAFAVSGVHVRFFKISNGNHANKWVRYLTKAGDYAHVLRATYKSVNSV